MRHKIYISREKSGLGHRNAEKLVKGAIAKALAAEKINVRCQINVMLTDDEGIHKVNREFRNVDRPTDVLSFPQNELVPGKFDGSVCEYDRKTRTVVLGDMMISIPRCEAQGKEFGHGFERELCYLTVHSVLHLLGYDHMDEGEQKKQMRGREKEIMEEE